MNFPCYERGQRITASSLSTTTELEGSEQRLMAARDVLLHNPGPYLVYVRSGPADVVADDLCAPLPGGSLWAYGKGPYSHLATYAPDGDQEILVLVAEGA